MDNGDMYHELEEWEIATPPLYKRLWWAFWGSPVTYHHGWRYWLESLYMWLGKRLPPGLVFYATHQLVEFAEERGMRTYDILEAQSDWLIEKVK